MNPLRFRCWSWSTMVAAIVLVALVETATAHPLDIAPSPDDPPGGPPPPVVSAVTADDVAAQIWSGWYREPTHAATDVGVAATEFEGRIHVFAKGGDDGRIRLQRVSGDSGIWDGAWTEVPGGFAGDPVLPEALSRPRPPLRTDATVATAATSTRLYLFARDARTGRISVNVKSPGTSPGQGWSGWGAESLPAGATDAAPAAAANETSVHVARKGLDGKVYVSRRAAGWSAWKPLPGPLTAFAPSAAADGPGRILVFRVHTSGAIYVNTREAGVWSKACLVEGGVLTDAPVGAARDGDALRLFHKGLDGRVYVQTLVDPHPYGDACGLWSLPAEAPGGGLIDAGVAAAYAKSGKRLFVFVKGFEVSDLYVNVNTVLATIHIQAIRVSDNDSHGGCGAPVADVTQDEVVKWVAYLNKAFAPAFLRLAFDPATDWATRCDTELNVSRPRLAKATSVAAAYPGKIVVFFRARSGGNGYSWWDPTSDDPWERVNFVLMPGFDETTVCGHQNLAQLAHDVGHYLGLPHTFPGMSNFASFAAARKWLADGNTMDGDGFSDTPEDPTIPVVNQCGPQPSLVTFARRAWEPPRTNVMSYYSDDESTFFLNPLVQTITPQQVQRIYQTIAERGLLPTFSVN